MEICHQHVDGTKSIARRDEQGGLPRKRMDGTVVADGAFKKHEAKWSPLRRCVRPRVAPR